MKLELQVTSADNSNQLKNLGVTSPSLFFRESPRSKESEVEAWENHESLYGKDNVNCYSVAELGLMLPMACAFQRNEVQLATGEIVPNQFIAVYLAEYGEQPTFERADTEADARAKLLIHLVEENIISSP